MLRKLVYLGYFGCERLLDEDMLAGAKCVTGQSEMASTSGSLRTTSAESTAEVREKLFSTKARRSGLESTTYFTEQFDRAEKFRSKFGPQYPHPTCANIKGLDSMSNENEAIFR